MAFRRARIAAAMSWCLFTFGMEFHKPFDERGGGLADARGGFQHLLVRQHSARTAGSEVGDAGEAGDAQPALAGDDGFGYGAHSDGVGAEAGKSSNLGGRFVARPADRKVYPGVQPGAGFAGGGSEQSAKLGRVNFRQVDEPFAARDLRSAERVRTHQVDMVAQAHEIPGAKADVNSARG